MKLAFKLEKTRVYGLKKKKKKNWSNYVTTEVVGLQLGENGRKNSKKSQAQLNFPSAESQNDIMTADVRES